MEKEIKLTTKDKHKIFGTLKHVPKSTKLVILIHGLGSHRNTHQFYNIAKFFAKKGISTFRFGLYAEGNGSRNLKDCTLSIHAADVNKIINFFQKKGYHNIHLVGHSFGGPTILLSDLTKVKSAVLWDPSYKLNWSNIEKETIFIDKLNSYLVAEGNGLLVGKDMYKEVMSINYDNLMETDTPIKVITAGKGNLTKMWRSGFFKINKDKNKELFVIKNASHNFDEEGVEETLFNETLKWIKRYK